ncbi:hypothetical protein D9M72_454920 [compost metagenome]
MAVPAFGEHRAPGAEVEAGHVLGLPIGNRVDADQLGGDVVPGMAAQRDGVLAGHGSEVSQVIGGGVGNIAGGENAVLVEHLQVVVDMQAAQGVAFAGQLFGQGTGAEADGPDHGAGFDARSVCEGYPLCIDRGHCGVQHPLDAQVVRCFRDGGADSVAHGGCDSGAPVDDDHADFTVVAQCCTQARRHFGSGFNAGKSTAGHHHGIARRAVGLVLE